MDTQIIKITGGYIDGLGSKVSGFAWRQTYLSLWFGVDDLTEKASLAMAMEL